METSSQQFRRAAWSAVIWVLCGLCVQVSAQSKPWDGKSRSEERTIARQQKEAQKQEEKAWKEFEENYKERQQRHYGFQKKHVKKRMRKGQQKARKHRDGRTIPWWRRIWLRNKWKDVDE